MLKSLGDFRADFEQQMIKLKTDIHPLQVGKLDIKDYEESSSRLYNRVQLLHETVDSMVQDVQTTGNYLQKYVPMQF